jgi:asparagine synthetase B (glutamine-hydrolysing)
MAKFITFFELKEGQNQYQFTTNTDTEILIALPISETWGALFQKVKGMFAFSLLVKTK